MNLRPKLFSSLLLAVGLLLSPQAGRTQETATNKTFFLPNNPVAAAYVLGRLSNKELIEAPRSEFVYVALLQRRGLERKYRLEALQGLAKARGSDSLTELIAGLSDLDKKGDESADVLRELGAALLQAKPEELAPKRAALEKLAGDSQLPLTRQIGLAGLITAEAPGERVWKDRESNPEQLADVILAIPFVRSATLRAGFYAKVEPLLRKEDSPDLRRAAMTAIIAIPDHDTETFKTLAAFVQAGVESPTAIRSLQRLPRKAWPKELAESLAGSLVTYLQTIPAAERTEADFLSGVQLATDLATLMPVEKARVLSKTLRDLGPTVIVLRTIYEQMLYDKQTIVVEAGKPVALILENEDAMQHNLVLVTPGALEEIGQASEKMPPEPDAQGRLYVPASPKVLHATKMLNQGQKAKLDFTAPTEPGDYQYLCTFPGHWRRMVGKMAVVKDVEAYLASQAANPEPKLTEWKLEDLKPDLGKVAAGRNLAQGKEQFTKLACLQCHKLGPEGSNYGPDLTDVLKRWKDDRASVLEQILEPSKVILDRYRNYLLELKDGDSLTGMIVKEEADSITIHTGPADTLIQTLKKSDLKERLPQNSSAMPVGLLSTLAKDQILDLLAFIESGGKVPVHEHNH